MQKAMLFRILNEETLKQGNTVAMHTNTCNMPVDLELVLVLLTEAAWYYSTQYH
jgi:hypothetical protein